VGHTDVKNEVIGGPETTKIASKEGDDELIDLRQFFWTVWRGKWIVAVCTIILVTLALLYVSQFEPRYKATASVMFDLQKTNVVDLQQVLVDQEFSKDTLQNQIEVLRSTNLIERVVEELGLEKSAEFNPLLREKKQTLLDRLSEITGFSLSELLKNFSVIEPETPRGAAEFQERSELLSVIENVRKDLEMVPVRGSRVIKISFESGNPRTAVRVVNSIANQYIFDQLNGKLQAAKSATQWLSNQVQDLEAQVNASEREVETQDINASLTLVRNEVSSAEAKEQRLRTALADGQDLGAIPEFRDSALIQNYRQTESTLITQEVALQSTVDENHPRLLQLRAQLVDVRRKMKAEAERIITATSISLSALKSQEDQLSTSARSLESKALAQSRDEVQLRQLEREVQASRALYENFLTRLQETSVQEDLQTADARVLSPAEFPKIPISQNEKSILLVSTILGALLGIGLVLLIDRLNNTFRGAQQLAEQTGHNLLATIPSAGRKLRRSTIISQLHEKSSSSLAEAIRNLRTSILFSNVDNPPKVVMFTSSVPREGKSTTAMLMALTSRQMGKSAIIVDCDLRLPALASLLSVNEDKPGLLSLMDDSASINEVIHKDPETGLHVLMTKPSERQVKINAADVLASKKFKELIQALSNHYELVILDTPPTLVVTDARIVASLADAVVYAVRWDSTPRGAVMEGLKELSSIDINVAGVVMTMVNEQKAARYSYDGYGYYKGQYRDYYNLDA